MKPLYMLDTDICGYVIKGTNPALNAKVKENKNRICISSITLAELLFGAKKKKSTRLMTSIEFFQQLVEVIPWGDETAGRYAEIRDALEYSGTPIGNMDMLIAAAAAAHGLCLVTNNSAHFSRVPGLKSENWME